jgi:hypothetical protein
MANMKLLPLLLLLVGIVAVVHAQDSPPPPPPNIVKFINDMTTPGSPPMTLLDAVPDKLKSKIPADIQ